MVSSVGSQLAKNHLITGFGVKRHTHAHAHALAHSHVGKGIARHATAAVVKMVGNAIVNKLAGAIHGGSYKLSGMGTRKPRKPRATLTRKPRATLTRTRKHRIMKM